MNIVTTMMNTVEAIRGHMQRSLDKKSRNATCFDSLSLDANETLGLATMRPKWWLVPRGIGILFHLNLNTSSRSTAMQLICPRFACERGLHDGKDHRVD